MSHLILCGRNVWNNSLERGVPASVSGDLEPSQSNMESQSWSEVHSEQQVDPEFQVRHQMS